MNCSIRGLPDESPIDCASCRQFRSPAEAGKQLPGNAREEDEEEDIAIAIPAKTVLSRSSCRSGVIADRGGGGRGEGTY
jgi:hypothetical protein